MRKIRHWLRDDKTHKSKSMVLLTVICHGDSSGNLMSTDGLGWQISDIVGTLNDVKTLAGKPKVFFVNACRGGRLI